MKKNKLLLFVFSAYANILGAQDTMQLESYWQQPIAAKESKTVLDYFMLLPREIVYCEAFFEDETFAQRKNFLTHVNTKNGYANNQVLEIALFKDRDNLTHEVLKHFSDSELTTIPDEMDDSLYDNFRLGMDQRRGGSIHRGFKEKVKKP